MRREWSPMREVHLIAKLADLSEAQYQNALILHALVELLVKKGVLSRRELAEQARLLDDRLNASLPGFDAELAERSDADNPPPAQRKTARIALAVARDGELNQLDGTTLPTPPPTGSGGRQRSP